jgi:predicted ATPase/DNA-binding winged helix-turn-helix (wHTH) protein
MAGDGCREDGCREEMSNIQRRIYRFGPYTLDLERVMLYRGEEPLRLAHKAIEVLAVLVQNRGQVVGKDELMEQVWPDQFVSESSITQHIYMLRKTLGDGDQYIVTISGRGYKFVAAVSEEPMSRVPDNGVPEHQAFGESQQSEGSSPATGSGEASEGTGPFERERERGQTVVPQRETGGRSAEQRSTNLPAEPTRLIGRDRDVAAIKELVRQDSVRILTLTGAPGSGKTRLAIRVASELAADYRDGVYFVGLAHLSDPALIIPTVAQVLGVGEDGKRTVAECVKAHLEEKDIMLLLDNFEHLLSGELALLEVVESCPGLKILVTSRIVLNLRVEQEYQVQPLDVRWPGKRDSFGLIAGCPSVVLFVERARAVKSEFSLTELNAATIAEICGRLDGLPLAIELAAPRLRLLTPEALLGRMGQRLGLLSGGPRDLPARQQNLRNMIQWSYDLLTSDERILFRRLGVFVGGFTLDAAETVCSGAEGERIDVMGLLSSLIDKNMVQSGPSNAGERQRYGMLETIREFAIEELTRSGEMPESRCQHADFYCGVAEEAEPMLVGPKLLPTLDLLEAEIGNLRAAMDWSVAKRSAEVGMRIVGATRRFWKLRGSIEEARSRVEELLSLREGTEAGVVAKALLAASLFLRFQQEPERAWKYIEEALSISRASEDRRGEAEALKDLASVSELELEHNQALNYLEQSYDLFSKDREKSRMALVLNDLGAVCFHMRQFDRSKAYYSQSLALSRELQDQWGFALTLQNYGLLLIHMGETEQAMPLLRECIQLAGRVGDTLVISACLESIAEVHYETKDFEKMICLLGAADALRSASGFPVLGYNRPRYDEMVNAAKAQLPLAEYHGAWGRGSAMTSAESIAYALATSEVDQESQRSA